MRGFEDIGCGLMALAWFGFLHSEALRAIRGQWYHRLLLKHFGWAYTIVHAEEQSQRPRALL